MEPWDVTIVGGGILGTSFAYWLANRYDGRIAVLEKESQVAMHTSRRNTGVVHRPFYLDPVGRKIFAVVSGRLWNVEGFRGRTALAVAARRHVRSRGPSGPGVASREVRGLGPRERDGRGRT